MRQSIKHTLALLTVIGASVAYASDSVSVATICKIVVEADEKYRIIYQAPAEENVTVQILDKKNELVYTEKLKTSGFVKKYDLSYLPKGEYQIEVKSGEYLFSEKLVVGDVSGFNFLLTPQKDRAVSIVGSHRDGKDMTIYILDQDDQVVYRESIDNTQQVHKRYNFSELKGESVTFLLYHDNELIKQQEIEF